MKDCNNSLEQREPLESRHAISVMVESSLHSKEEKTQLKKRSSWCLEEDPHSTQLDDEIGYGLGLIL